MPDQSRAERRTSYDVADFAIPGGREEDWRFTPVDRLGGLFQVEPTDESRLTIDIAAPRQVEVSEATADDAVFGSVLLARGAGASGLGVQAGMTQRKRASLQGTAPGIGSQTNAASRRHARLRVA